MNKKNQHLFFLTFFLLAFVLTSCLSKEEEYYQIALLSAKPGTNHLFEGIEKTLSKNGYDGGNNTTFYYREKDETVEKFITRMISRNINLFFTVTTPITRLVKEHTKKSETPVVFIMNDPVNSDIVREIKEPGGNLTGIQLKGSTAKTLEWLKSLNHETAHVWVPVSFDTKAAMQSYKDLELAAEKLDITLWLNEVNSLSELKESFNHVPEEIDSIFVFHSILINSNLDLIAKKSIELKLPLAGSGHEQYKKGALLSYGIGHAELSEHAGRLIISILKGASPSTTPVETADFFLGINLKTAQQINVEIPDHFIEQANSIIR